MVYIAWGMTKFFVSKEACRALGIIEENFPRVGALVESRVLGASRRRSSSAPPPLTGPGFHGGGQGLGTLGSPVLGTGMTILVPESNVNLIYPNYDDVDGDVFSAEDEVCADTNAPAGGVGYHLGEVKSDLLGSPTGGSHEGHHSGRRHADTKAPAGGVGYPLREVKSDLLGSPM